MSDKTEGPTVGTPEGEDNTPMMGDSQPREEKAHTYDADAALTFLQDTFHADSPDGAQVLFWATNNQGKIGKPMQTGLIGMRRKMDSGKAHGWYYNTATYFKDETGLNHQHKNFAALHVVVCDDIGTKIEADLFTEKNLDPTYIIKTSKGNFQYGFVLEEPITDYDQACALVQCMNVANLTDEGGVMAGKLVRLPCGINGKRGQSKHDDLVTLVDGNGPRWTAEQLVKRIAPTVDGELITWEQIQAGDQPLHRKTRTSFMTRPPIHFNTANIQDPVLDWLDEQDLLLGDGGQEWVDIECPWCELHTTGDNTAGYKPLGRGEHPQKRFFHCFHEHCATNHTPQFLEYVLSNSDFRELAIYDPCNIKPSETILYAPKSKVFILAGGRPVEYLVEGFRMEFNASMNVMRESGGEFKWCLTTEAAHWLHSPYRIDVKHIKADAGKKVLFLDENKHQCLNLFKPPRWTDGVYKQDQIEPFKRLLDYLLPEPEEHDYVLQTLAAKMQDWTFRGTALVMRTPTQGVGRNTLALMMTQLVGEHNASPDMDFGEFIGGKYNEWQDNLFVFCSEAIETGENSAGRFKAYEALKKRIDTNNTKVRVNPKYGSTYEVTCCATTWIFSNHMATINLSGDDRRITVLTNPLTRNSPAYFIKLRAWMKANPEWPLHVYRWLRQMDVDLAPLMLPLETVGKQIMIDKSEPELKKFLRVCDEYMESKGITYFNAGILEDIADAVISFDCNENRSYWRRAVDEISHTFNKKAKFRVAINQANKRPRIRISKFIELGMRQKDLSKFAGGAVKATARDDLNNIDIAEMRAYVADEMEE